VRQAVDAGGGSRVWMVQRNRPDPGSIGIDLEEKGTGQPETRRDVLVADAHETTHTTCRFPNRWTRATIPASTVTVCAGGVAPAATALVTVQPSVPASATAPTVRTMRPRRLSRTTPRPSSTSAPVGTSRNRGRVGTEGCSGTARVPVFASVRSMLLRLRGEPSVCQRVAV